MGVGASMLPSALQPRSIEHASWCDANWHVHKQNNLFAATVLFVQTRNIPRTEYRGSVASRVGLVLVFGVTSTPCVVQTTEYVQTRAITGDQRGGIIFEGDSCSLH